MEAASRRASCRAAMLEETTLASQLPRLGFQRGRHVAASDAARGPIAAIGCARHGSLR